MFERFFNFNKKAKSCPFKPVILLSLDGWGIAPSSRGNAVAQANTPNLDSFVISYPHGELIASGESVGLPANEVGNSEVGHLTMGSGRTILQSLERINKSIEDESFYDSDVFIKAYEQVKNNNSNLHLIGLVGSGNVHSSTSHLFALLEFCRRYQLKNTFIHLFTDGRDAPPQEALEIIEKVQFRISECGVGDIASISGRYFGMDRDGKWDRTKKSFDAISKGIGLKAKSAEEAIQNAYSNGLTDEFIEPTVISNPNFNYPGVKDNDALIFFNFRADRMRQIVMPFVISDFENLKTIEFGFQDDQGNTRSNVLKGNTFQREIQFKNIFSVTMTEYQKKLPVSAIAFPLYPVTDTLAETISKKQLKQLRIAESEKERMVTYYFDGLRSEPFEGEDVVIVRSPNVATYDKKPEMSANQIVSKFKDAINSCKYHFIMINFANPDMVAHTGNLQATIKALEITDKVVGQVVNEVLKFDGIVFITADHGNAEELLTYPNTSFFYTTSTGNKNTDHSNNPVPLYVISNQYKGKALQLKKGSLVDVATTVLSTMGIEKPSVMTGSNLLNL